MNKRIHVELYQPKDHIKETQRHIKSTDAAPMSYLSGDQITFILDLLPFFPAAAL